MPTRVSRLRSGGSAPPPVRRLFTAVSSIAFVVLLLLSLPASWNYVAFMKREHTAYLHLRLDAMYSIYVIFVVACTVKQARIAWRAITGADGGQPDKAAETAVQ